MDGNATDIVDRAAGCLAGVAIGDALGMPVETRKHGWIMALNGGRGVLGFMPSLDGHFRSYAAGDTTDDFQLTRAVVRSLTRTGGRLDLADCAAEHVAEWTPERTAWGRSTHDAVRDIREGRRDPRVPLTPTRGGKIGSGAGVVMKVAGLAIVHALRGTRAADLATDCMSLGSLTHSDPVAATTAYAVAEAIRARLLGRCFDAEAVADHCLALSGDREFPSLLRGAPEIADAGARRLAPYPPFSAAYCALFSISTALAHGDDFRAAVFEAVNAGGDADTNASVVGAIVGAGVGYRALPVDMRDFRAEYAAATGLARDLCAAVAGERKGGEEEREEEVRWRRR